MNLDSICREPYKIHAVADVVPVREGHKAYSAANAKLIGEKVKMPFATSLSLGKRYLRFSLERHSHASLNHS